MMPYIKKSNMVTIIELLQNSLKLSDPDDIKESIRRVLQILSQYQGHSDESPK